LLLASLAGVGSCASSASLGHVDLWLKSCNGHADDCDDASASVAAEEYVHTQAFFDASSSRYAPHGLYTYFELPRADGSVGILELDLPTNGANGQPLTNFQASYRELSGDQVLFSSRKVEGRLELPPGFAADQEPVCACDDGAFALRFIDAGPDRVRGTDDDRVRHLSWGRIGRSEHFCRGLAPMAIGRELQLNIESCVTPGMSTFQPSAQEPEPVQTYATDPQPVLVTTTPAPASCGYACYGNPPPSQPTSSGGCGSDDSSSSGGCGSDDSSSSGCGSGSGSSDSSSGGCGGDDSSSSGCGDSQSDSQSSSSGSCDSSSNSGSGSSSSGACEGDTTDDHSSSCTVARARPQHGRRGHRRDPFVGTGVPLALVCLLQQLRARRLRQAQGVYRAADAV
jgi:hypothetical protein